MVKLISGVKCYHRPFLSSKTDLSETNIKPNYLMRILYRRSKTIVMKISGTSKTFYERLHFKKLLLSPNPPLPSAYKTKMKLQKN